MILGQPNPRSLVLLILRRSATSDAATVYTRSPGEPRTLKLPCYSASNVRYLSFIRLTTGTYATYIFNLSCPNLFCQLPCDFALKNYESLTLVFTKTLSLFITFCYAHLFLFKINLNFASKSFKQALARLLIKIYFIVDDSVCAIGRHRV